MEASLQQRIQEKINQHPILIFMKGTPAMPQCGFSNAVIGIFNELGANYETIDILEDQEVRQGIKEFSNWPTIPQVYIKGQFVGGCDIIKEMHQRGELNTLIASH